MRRVVGAGNADGKTLLALAVTIFFWGISPPGIRAALAAYSPGHVALLRFLAASLTLAVYAGLVRMRLPARRDLAGLMFVGLFGTTFYHVFLNFGLVTVHAGAASLLINTAPVFTALLATFLLGERMRAWGWAGMFVSLVGAALVTLGQGKELRFEPGALLLMAGAVAWSLNIVLQKPFLGRYSALEVTSYAIWFGTFFLLVFLPGLPDAVRRAPVGMTLFVIYLGVIPIAVAYVLWAYVLARMTASRAAGFLYLIPVIVFIAAWVGLGERPTSGTLVGGVVIIAGVTMVNRLGRAPSREKQSGVVPVPEFVPVDSPAALEDTREAEGAL
jgi:drug/metabolite transporter (DMT)-like permease